MLFGGSGIHEILKCLSKANLVIPLSIFLLEKTDVQSIFFFFSLWSLSIVNSHSCKKKNKLYLWSSVVYQIIYFSMTRFLLLLSCWINILICTLWHLPLLLHFKTPKRGIPILRMAIHCACLVFQLVFSFFTFLRTLYSPWRHYSKAWTICCDRMGRRKGEGEDSLSREYLRQRQSVWL